jgi:PKD repeat protein
MSVGADVPNGESDVTLTVADLDSQAPVTGASVDVWFYADAGGYAETSLTTDGSGTVTVSGLPAGDLEARVSHPSLPYIAQWSWTHVDGQADKSLLVALVLGGTLSGRVTDSAGQPVEGVCASVTGPEGWGWYGGACTAVDGTFRTTGLAAGEYRVRFDDEQDRYLSAWYDGKTAFEDADPVFVSLGSDTPGIDGSMRSGARISGKVTTKDGAPISSAWITVYDQAGEHWVDSTDVSATGTFTVGPLAAGQYTIRASDDDGIYLAAWLGGAPGAEGSTRISISEQQAVDGAVVLGADFQLARGGAIFGTILDEEGNPLWACAQVYSGVSEYSQFAACTNASGEYRVGGLPRGEFKLYFYGNDVRSEWFDDAPDRDSATSVTLTDAEPDATANARLASSVALQGRLLDAVTGDPISFSGSCEAAVSVYKVDNPAYPTGSGCVGTDGRYSIALQDPGDYKIQFWGGQNHASEWHEDAANFDAATAVALTPGTPTTIDARLTPSASIGGTLAVAQAKVSAGQVQVWAKPAPGATWPTPVKSAWTDAQGAYRVWGLPAGEYLLYFRDSSTGDGIPEWWDDSPTWQGATAVPVGVGQTVTGIDADLTLGGRIAGSVVDSAGQLIPGCSASASSSGAGYSTGHDCPNGVLGRGLPTGLYQVYISGPGYQPRTIGDSGGDAVEVVAGQTTNLGTITLEQAAILTGRITSESTGLPMGGSVEVYPVGSSNYIWSAYASVWGSESDGRYRVDTLPPGDYHVRVRPNSGVAEWHDNRPTRESADMITLVAGESGTTVDFAVAEGLSISGTVTMRTGGSLVATSLSLYRVEGTDQPVFQRSVSSNTSGAFTFGGVVDGDYLISVGNDRVLQPQWHDGTSTLDSNAWTGVTPITVAGEPVSGVAIQVKPVGSVSGLVAMRSTGDPVSASLHLYRVVEGQRQFRDSVRSDDRGEFTFGSLPDGDYLIHVSGDDLESQWHDGTPSWDSNAWTGVTPFAVAGGAVTDLEILVKRQPQLTGTVTTEDGDALPSARVDLVSSGYSYIGLSTGANGVFSVPVHRAGEYTLRFGSPSGGAYIDEYFDDSPTLEGAEVITISEEQYAEGGPLGTFDASLTRAPYTISGTVTNDAGQPIAWFPVLAGGTVGYTNNLGRYDIGVQPGSHLVRFGDPWSNSSYPTTSDSYRPEYYSGAVRYQDSSALTVETDDPATHHFTGIDAALASGGEIAGRVTDLHTGEGLGDSWPRQVRVYAVPEDSSLPTKQTYTRSDGSFRLAGLPEGRYRVRALFSDPNVYSSITRWHPSASDAQSADPIQVDLGGVHSGIDIQVPISKPLPPEGLAARPGSQAVKLSWQSADTRSNPLRGYQVEVQPGPIVRDIGASTTPNTEVTVSGLVNGTEYTARVRTRTDAGWSAWSDSVVFTPGSMLVWTDPPVATRSDRAIDVQWTPPEANGADILGYTVQAVDPSGNTWGNASAGPSATSSRVTGLANGIEYRVVVRARNEIGTTDSDPSNPVIPAGVPFAPPGVEVTAGDRTLDVGWSPASGNGAEVLGYIVTARRLDGVETRVELGADVTTATVTGLANGARYRVLVRASNEIGLGQAAWSGEVTPRAAVNGSPSAILSVTPTEGTAPLAVAATLDFADPDGDWMTYRIDYGDGAYVWKQVTDGGRVTLEHTYRQVGTFQVRAVVDDGLESIEKTQTVTIASPEPLQAAAGEDTVVTLGQLATFDASASRPTGIRHTYSWDFGDGTTAAGLSVSHTYRTPGEFTATLTVSDGVDQSVDEVLVRVLEPADTALTVAVSGAGSLLSGATVTVNDPAGTRHSCVTGITGNCTLSGLPDGQWAVHAYAPGFKPATTTTSLSGGLGLLDITLQTGDIAVGQLNTRPMTPEEIEAVGIDTTDPANRNVVEFSIIIQGQLLHGYAGEAGGGTCWCSGGAWGGWTDDTRRRYVPQVRVVNGRPVLVVLATGQASWLKEFFQVDLIVTNLADDGYTFSGGAASLNLPSGLSLAPTAKPQSLSQPVADIPGTQSSQTTWVVRGDVKGKYDLSATYAATLEPLGVPISLLAETSEPLQVWGTDAVRLEATLDSKAYTHHPYPFEIELTNVADVPIYNVRLEIEEGDWILQPRQQRSESVAALAPGASLRLPIRVVSRANIQVDSAESFLTMVVNGDTYEQAVKLREPEVTPATAPKLTVDTTRRKTANLSWDPIPGATEYQIFATSDPSTPFPDEPLVVVDGATTRTAGPIEDGQSLHFAVSATVDGKPTMLHPLTEAEGTLGSAPVIRVEDQNTLVIGNGSLLDNRNEDRQLTIRAFDADSQVPEVRVETWVRNAGYQSDGEYDFTETPGRMWPIQPDAPAVTILSRLNCWDTVATDDANAVRICNLPKGDYQEKVVVTATDPDGHSTEHTVYVGPEYVAMGDSYSSGEGAVPDDESVETLGPDRYWFSQFGKTDMADNLCHRSTEAYANLLRGQANVPERFEFAACSGARTWHVNPEGDVRKGFGDPNDQYGEGRQANLERPFASVVTLSVGGNDVGFSSIIRRCGMAPCQKALAEGVEESKQWLKEVLPKTYRAVLRSAPNADVYVVGYPKFFNKDHWSDLKPCPAALTVDNIALGILPGDQAWINHQIGEVNEAIQEAVLGMDSARLHYVDASDAIDGHHACSGEPWMNDFEDAGLGAANWVVEFLTNESMIENNTIYSFHPNRQGHIALKERFLEKIVEVERNKRLVGQDETKATTWLVQPGQQEFVVATSWDGSDIVTTLISPSGRVIGRDTVAGDVDHSLSHTSEVYRVTDPEPGEWRIESFGADLPDGKELLRLSIGTTPRPTSKPSAASTVSATASSPGEEIVFDASNSTDEDDNIVAYIWEFGDGETEEGVSVTHSYSVPGVYEPSVTVIDAKGNPATSRPGSITVTDQIPVFTSEAPLATALVGVDYAFKFVASSVPQYAVSEGSLPDGLTLAESGELSGTPGAAGAFTFSVTATNSAGSTVAGPFTILVTGGQAPVDTTPPVVVGAVDLDPNAAGWYAQPVTVTWTATDDVDGVLTSPPPIAVGEGADQAVTSAEVCDTAGNCATGWFGPISVDMTPPEIVTSVSGTANGSGWRNQAPTVTFTCTDPLSGVASCTDPQQVTDGDNLSVTGEAVDVAGNRATATVDALKVDTVAPTLKGAPAEEPNDAGWYRSDVSIAWTCADELSGISGDACPADSVLTGDGEDLVVTASVSDRAGNLSPADSAAVSIDRTAPVTTATAPDGWSGTDVTVELAATDALSGVASTSWSLDGSTPTEGTSVLISGDGTHALTFFSVDEAGNAEEPVTIEVKLDASGPIVTHEVSPEPNEAGWNREPVTVHFECSDLGAGVATCPEDVTVSTEGAGQVVSGEAVDAAGNRTVDHVVVNLDLTDPVVSGALGEEPNAAGWYRNPVPVTWTCTDALSGVADCPEPVTLTQASPGPVEATVTDVAGNTATARVGPVKIDTTAPTVDLTGFTDGATYLLGTALTPRCTASDAGSGLVGECTVTVTGGTTDGMGEFTVTAVARDVAGNSTSVTARYRVAYRWTGFLSPISSTGISSFTAGSTVPVKFTLTDADGNVVQPGSAPQWLTPQRGPKIGKSLTAGVMGEPQPSGTTFTRSDQYWQYNWKTKKSDRGYYWRIGARLDDGEVYQVWIAVK